MLQANVPLVNGDTVSVSAQLLCMPSKSYAVGRIAAWPFSVLQDNFLASRRLDLQDGVEAFESGSTDVFVS